MKVRTQLAANNAPGGEVACNAIRTAKKARCMDADGIVNV